MKFGQVLAVLAGGALVVGASAAAGPAGTALAAATIGALGLMRNGTSVADGTGRMKFVDESPIAQLKAKREAAAQICCAVIDTPLAKNDPFLVMPAGPIDHPDTCAPNDEDAGKDVYDEYAIPDQDGQLRPILKQYFKICKVKEADCQIGAGEGPVAKKVAQAVQCDCLEESDPARPADCPTPQPSNTPDPYWATDISLGVAGSLGVAAAGAGAVAIGVIVYKKCKQSRPGYEQIA